MMLEDKVKLPLLSLRLGVFTVLAVWTLLKFLHPERTAAVWDRFYGVSAFGELMSYGTGVVQAAIIIGFLIGFAKTYSYGLVFAMHAMGTLTPIANYLRPYEDQNLMFFAAWPMLAACFALFVLRDYDTLLTIRNAPKARA